MEFSLFTESHRDTAQVAFASPVIASGCGTNELDELSNLIESWPEKCAKINLAQGEVEGGSRKSALCFTARRKGTGRLIFGFPAAEERACIVPKLVQGASNPFSSICLPCLSSSSWAFRSSGVLVLRKPSSLPMNIGIGP